MQINYKKMKRNNMLKKKEQRGRKERIKKVREIRREKKTERGGK